MRNSLNSKSCCIGEYQETENVNSLRTLFRNIDDKNRLKWILNKMNVRKQNEWIWLRIDNKRLDHVLMTEKNYIPGWAKEISSLKHPEWIWSSRMLVGQPCNKLPYQKALLTGWYLSNFVGMEYNFQRKWEVSSINIPPIHRRNLGRGNKCLPTPPTNFLSKYIFLAIELKRVK